MYEQRDNERLDVKKRMGCHEKEFMLAHLLRLPILFAEAKVNLKSEHFDPIEDKHYALLWEAAIKVADNNNGNLLTDGMTIRLELETSKILEEFPDAITEEQRTELFGEKGLIKWVASLTLQDLRETDGRALLESFLEERTVSEALKTLVTQLGDNSLINLGKFLGQLSGQLQKIKSINATQTQETFPDDWTPAPVNITTTGLSFLDQMMDGGQAPGEVYLLLGPTGVGKTTLAVQLAVQGALFQQVLHEEGQELGHWFIFTYESPVDPELRYRVFSYAAQIHRDSLWKMRSLSELSTISSLKPYEIAKYQDQIVTGTPVMGEYERLMGIKAKLNKNLWLVDMSGANKDNPKIGSGGVEEIARYLTRKSNEGMKIAGYVIDYAGKSVERYMAENRLKEENKRLYLSRYAGDCVRLLSAPYGAAGWVLHQLSGAANSKSPTARQGHTDAAECKTMADAAWFAFSIGTKDLSTSTCQISCSKTRRAAGDAKDRVLYVDGAFCNISSADGRFSLDPRSKRIVSSDDLKKIMGGSGKGNNMSNSAVREKRPPNPFSTL